MKVRMRAEISGMRDGKPWPGRGQLVDLPADEAVRLCETGMADPVASDRVETAVSPLAEARDALVRTRTRTRK